MGVETVEALVLAVQYKLFSLAVEAVDIGRAAPLEMDLVETREVGRDVVNVSPFPVLFREMVNCKPAVKCVLPQEVGSRGRREIG